MTVDSPLEASETLEGLDEAPIDFEGALTRITAASEQIRHHALEQRKLIDVRDDFIRQAIDLYGCSYRQVARASSLSLGRITGIMAND